MHAADERYPDQFTKDQSIEVLTHVNLLSPGLNPPKRSYAILVK